MGIGPPHGHPETKATPRYTPQRCTLEMARPMHDHPHACQWLRKEEAA